jgi:hypothetical protein
MKIKTLKRILNTNYIIQKETITGNLAIGSSYVHDIITVDAKTLEIKCKDVWSKNIELEIEYICCKLKELVKLGIMRDIMDNNDDIENPITVYYYDHSTNSVKGTKAETFGYPNTDIDGYLQYDNTHFLYIYEALECAIRNTECLVELETKLVKQYLEKYQKTKEDLKLHQKQILILKQQALNASCL